MIDDDFVKALEEQDCDVLRVREWKTPATDYPLGKRGSVEIVRKDYRKGVYLMEGVANKDFFFVEKRIPVTSLKISGKTWMVDDPLHWEGMKRLAQKSKGNVLIGGLGLGLVLHALANNPDVKRIDVVERNKDVIELIKDLVPRKVNIHEGDVFDEKWFKKDYNTVILDLWITETANFGDMIRSFATFKTEYPEANVYIWGMREPSINPAVEKTKLCKFYQELMRMSKRRLMEL